MDNELKSTITKILLDEFSYIDCGKCTYCDTPDCEDYTCYPKQTRWTLAPEAAESLANIIISHFPTSIKG